MMELALGRVTTLKKIIIYASDDCPACAEVVPIIKKLAKKKKVPVKIVDVDKCGKPCDWIKYVPLIKVDGKEVKDMNKLARMLM